MAEIEDWYEKVSDIYPIDEFKNKIEQKRKEYHDLLEEETLAHMIVAEEGRDENAVNEISSIQPGEEATIEGKIVDLGKLRTFENDQGQGRVRNVRIDDGTGTVKVVFWDDDTERVEEEFSLGDKLKVVNGYVQDKGYGMQISTGRWGEVILINLGKKD
ncbi:MAG: OB-fold nucleic acid binding domain-containing protein [Thermoplasmata archaeon]